MPEPVQAAKSVPLGTGETPSNTAGVLPVSVVVPARDEAESIDALLESLLGQSRPPAEIVIVDAGSRDDTAARVERGRARHEGVRLLQIGPAYPGEARNVGIAVAAHAWIALTDAGIRVDRHWLAELWAAREREPEAELVFGHFEPALTGWFTECAALTYVPPCEEREGRWWRGGSVASMLLRRDLWRRLGGFPPFRAAEDLVFLEAVARDGCRTAAAPAARVTWEIPAGMAGTFRRFASYSYHNLVAGRARHWHRGVARLYAAAGLVGLAGALLAPEAWLLLPAAAGARAGRAIRARRRGSGVRAPWRPDRWAGVAAIQLLLDAATFWGALAWVREERFRSRRPARQEAVRSGG